MRYLLIGLGNIGAMYAHTRHNVGFMVIDYLAQQHRAIFKPALLGAITQIRYKGGDARLLKPSTYMNHSGKAVRHWLEHLSVPLENLLVITDDLHLPFGQLRLKPQGGNAGHNGLKSIAQALHTTHYSRLRLGIGSSFLPEKQADFVLSDFTPNEKNSLPACMAQASQMASAFCSLGIQQAMNLYNKKALL